MDSADVTSRTPVTTATPSCAPRWYDCSRFAILLRRPLPGGPVLRTLLFAALICAPTLARAADQTGQIDWTRRVIKAKGVGAPDLEAASISSARLKAEQAAKGDALRNLLEVLQGAELTTGDKLGTLLQNDATMKSKVSGTLRGFRVVEKHYFADTGVSVDVEAELDKLPPELLAQLKQPAPGGPPKSDGKEAGASPPKQDGNGTIDWSRKVIQARGQGLPDLNSTTTATARMGTERAAKLDAISQLMKALKAASLEAGGTVADLLDKDDSLRAKLENKLGGYKVVAPHYYKDGGVALDVEVEFDKLPAELGKLIPAPKAQ